MARSPAGRKPKVPAQAEALSKAANFVKVAATNDGILGVNALHVRVTDKMMMGFDGQLAAGHPIEEELQICPNMEQLAKALKYCGKTLTIAVTPNGKLSMKGDKLKALVSCLPFDSFTSIYPDPFLCAADDRIKDSFKICSALADENAEKVYCASVLLEANQCTGTSGSAMIQHYHGHNLPTMVLPKVFAVAVAAAEAPISGLGFVFNQEGRVNSLTVWFESGAWLKTMTYADDWPDVSRQWLDMNLTPAPEGFFEAGAIVSTYHENKWVTMQAGEMWSHRSNKVGAQYEVKGLQAGKQFSWKLLKLVEPWAKHMDLTSYQDRMFFTGDNGGPPVRGIVMCIKDGSEEEAPPEEHYQADPPVQEDDAAPKGGWGEGGGWGTPTVSTDDDVPFNG